MPPLTPATAKPLETTTLRSRRGRDRSLPRKALAAVGSSSASEWCIVVAAAAALYGAQWCAVLLLLGFIGP